MIKMLSGTVVSKALIAVLNLLIISIAGRELGMEAVGTISLIVLSITIIMLINNFIGGGAVTFLVTKYPIRAILLPSYLWALATAILGLLLVTSFELVPDRFQIHVVALAFIQSIYTVHLGILLGKERLAVYNTLSAIQVIILFVVFFALMRSGAKDVFHYILASYTAFGFTALASAVVVHRINDTNRNEDSSDLIPRMFKQGGFIQLANIFQLLSYRFNYFLIERFLGLGALGTFSIGTQLSEGSWLIPKSIGTVLYMKVSNESEEQKRVSITVSFMHLAMISAALILAILVLIPKTVYAFVFGSEIGDIPTLVLLLTPGILSMAGAQALSHYFSGVGENHQNSIASAIAMLLTVVLGLLLIPDHGILGAAMVASVAYSGLFVYQLITFVRSTNTGISALLPDRASITQLVELLSSK